MDKQIKVLAISHAYIEPFTRIGFVNSGSDINLTVVLPQHCAKKNKYGYELLLKENVNVIKKKTYLNFHNSVHFYGISIVKIFKEVNPEIVFIGYEPWSSACFEIVFLCKKINPKIKIILYTCENILRKYPLPFRWMEKYVLKNVDLILTVTKFEGEKVLRKKGYFGKTDYLPLSVDVKNYIKKDVSWLKNKYFDNGKIVIGFVGRLVKQKGIYILLELLKKLDRKYALMIVGSGIEKNNLIKTVVENNLNERVIFVDNVKHYKLVDYINCFDVLVLPSITTKIWKEQFGRVLIESMSCKVPVVGSSSGEIPQVINGCGLVFEEQNVDDLKDKIEILFQDKILRESLVVRAYKMVQENYSRDVVYSKTEKIYKDIIK